MRQLLNRPRTDILVATPGRLIDLMENGGIQKRFSNLREWNVYITTTADSARNTCPR